MRTIKFRGKRVNDGQWVYGDLETRPTLEVAAIHQYDENGIYDCQDYVDKDTIGQFTGLHDKNGKEIYEGDILLHNGNRRTVEWKYGTFGLSMHKNGFPFQAFYELPVPIVDSTVVGNVHDNPELMKGGNK